MKKHGGKKKAKSNNGENIKRQRHGINMAAAAWHQHHKIMAAAAISARSVSGVSIKMKRRKHVAKKRKQQQSAAYGSVSA